MDRFQTPLDFSKYAAFIRQVVVHVNIYVNFCVGLGPGMKLVLGRKRLALECASYDVHVHLSDTHYFLDDTSLPLP